MASSVRQHQVNKALTGKLLVLQRESGRAAEQKKEWNNKIDETKRKMISTADSIKDLRTQKQERGMAIREIEARSRQLQESILGLKFSTEQSIITTDKMRQDIAKIS